MAGKSKTIAKLPVPAPAEQTSIGELARIDGEGQVFVRAAAGAPELPALVLNAHALQGRLLAGARLLLLRNDADPGRPIVLGVLDECVELETGAKPAVCEVNGRKIHLRGEDEVRLTCGASTIVLSRDGRIVVRGARIVSRAAETHRLKGGTVKIN